MKKFLFLLWLFPAVSFAQTDSTQLKSHNIYCKIFIRQRTLSSKIFVEYDFGRKSSNLNFSGTELRKLTSDLSGFDDEVDALNYMSIQGWEVISYNELRDQPRSYLLRKKAVQQ